MRKMMLVATLGSLMLGLAACNQSSGPPATGASSTAPAAADQAGKGGTGAGAAGGDSGSAK